MPEDIGHRGQRTDGDRVTPGGRGSEPVRERAVSSWNVPNALTAVRILLVPLFGWMLLAHPDEADWRLATTGTFLAAILTDTLDGYLDRRQGAHRDGLCRSVDYRRTAVVGDDHDLDPGMGDHGHALLRVAIRGDGRGSWRQDQDRLAVGGCEPVPASAAPVGARYCGCRHDGRTGGDRAQRP